MLIILMTMLLPITAYCDDEHENTTLIGRWAHGPYRTVAVQNDIAYFGCGAALRIFDYSDPENPEELGELAFPNVMIDIEVDGNYAYLAIHSYGLYIVDISNANHPEVVSIIEDSNPLTWIALYDHYAILSCRYDGLRIIDVSNPEEPEEVGTWRVEGGTYSIVMDNEYCYVLISDVDPGLYVIDLSDPIHPSQTGFLSFDVNNSSLYKFIDIYRDFVYIGNGGALYIVDVSDIEDITVVSNVYRDIADANDVAFSDDFAYVATSGGEYSGLSVLNIQNPSEPNVVSSPNSSYSMYNLVFDNDIVYSVSKSTGRFAYDVTEPDNPVLLSNFYDSGAVNSVSISGNYCYIDESNLITVLNIRDIEHPLHLNSILLESTRNTSVWTTYEDYLLVENGFYDLEIYDISDRANPELLSDYNGDYNQNRDVRIVGDIVYFLTNDGLALIDISDPTDPVERSFCEIFFSLSIDVVYPFAYVGTSIYTSLLMFDISDPDDIRFLGRYDAPNYVSGIAVQGDYAYLATRNDGLRIIDVFDFDNPFEVGSLSFDDFIPKQIKVAGNYAYLIDWENLWIVDIKDSHEPFITGYYNMKADPDDLDISGNYVFVATGSSGLYIIRNDDATSVEEELVLLPSDSPILFQNYPNPFNSMTYIPFYTNIPGNYSLYIFNVQGRLIYSDIINVQKTGQYLFSWNGLDCCGRFAPNGTYLAVIEGSFFKDSLKIIYLR
ncbi:T9SS type A sorting domain-containing protein [bacterium]|nr:T9SS type A sorting domain-containing protein [bacterium]